MKSKNTKYNGYYFRSRLEARWAVFFDALGIDYRYEDQDFVLPDGVRYLPDFWLPDYHGGAFAEVKHEFTIEEKLKCRMLCEMTKKHVLLLEDTPGFKEVLLYTMNNKWEGYYKFYCLNGFLSPMDFDHGHLVKRAIMMAKSARFEFNS